jgi:hypothetical protein
MNSQLSYRVKNYKHNVQIAYVEAVYLIFGSNCFIVGT